MVNVSNTPNFTKYRMGVHATYTRSPSRSSYVQTSNIHVNVHTDNTFCADRRYFPYYCHVN